LSITIAIAAGNTSGNTGTLITPLLGNKLGATADEDHRGLLSSSGDLRVLALNYLIRLSEFTIGAEAGLDQV
jgi:hypothetical protein